ncbi:hypothetical protein ARMGADRAFT_1031927 [Armillaria gallica]|uniref:Uncharacterized protein n=1 Tax=Armillaria gallica TaxID=47427 RepID=A0A2H3DK85_ARMGA|nr:hypothetical protein ARMGADRAFT_1031927 [Armillaria gallica]
MLDASSHDEDTGLWGYKCTSSKTIWIIGYGTVVAEAVGFEFFAGTFWYLRSLFIWNVVRGILVPSVNTVRWEIPVIPLSGAQNGESEFLTSSKIEHCADSLVFISGEIVAQFVLKEEQTAPNRRDLVFTIYASEFYAVISGLLVPVKAHLKGIRKTGVIEFLTAEAKRHAQASGELRLNTRKFDREMNDTASVPPWHDIRGLRIRETCGMALRGTV